MVGWELEWKNPSPDTLRELSKMCLEEAEKLERVSTIDNPLYIYKTIKEIVYSDNIDWVDKYGAIFNNNVSGKWYKLVDYRFEYCDPDTSYEEDVMAFYIAVKNYIFNYVL